MPGRLICVSQFLKEVKFGWIRLNRGVSSLFYALASSIVRFVFAVLISILETFI
jgi:hypothetical protein